MNKHQQSKTKRELKAIKVTDLYHAVIVCTWRQNYFFLPVTCSELSYSLTSAIVLYEAFFGQLKINQPQNAKEKSHVYSKMSANVFMMRD